MRGSRGFRCVTVALLAAAGAGASSCAGKDPGGEPAIAGGYDVPTPGAWLTYQVTPAGSAAYTQTQQITAASSDGFVRRSYTGASTSYFESVYQVVGGAELLSGSNFYRTDGTPTLAVGYAPPELILPSDVAPGATASSTSTATGGTSTYTVVRDVTVGWIETVTVPAGTFQALRVTAVLTQSNLTGTSDNVAWWAPGVGRVKIVNFPTATPSSTTTWELTSAGQGPLPIVRPEGTFLVTAIRCNGVFAPSPLADLISAPRSLALSVSGTTATLTWSDGTCSISEATDDVYPSIGHVTLAPHGPFGCSPGATACAPLSAETFGGNVCGATDASGARSYTFDPATVAPGGAVTLTRIGGTECASAGATDPISYVLTRQ